MQTPFGRMSRSAAERKPAAMRHVFAVFVFYLLLILAGITYFMVIGLRHL